MTYLVPLVKRSAAVLLPLAVAISAAACSSKPSGGAGGAGGAGSTCPETLATACAPGEQAGEFGVSCAPTWPLALADTHYCGTTITEKQADCGAYTARQTINVDVGFTYYYEKATGALVAVFGEGLSGDVSCVGGPATFDPPACGASQPLDPCGDGGADGG